MGAWFVLSALGLFSTVPGSPLLVLGSPIFPHVRIWRGKCDAGGEAGCDYSESGSGGSANNAAGKRQEDRNSPHAFPPDSSYLDVVALGTSPAVCKVAEITFNGAILPAAVSGSTSLRKDSGAGSSSTALLAECFSCSRFASPFNFMFLHFNFIFSFSALLTASGPNMATIADSLLQRDGVLRFVMDGERVNGLLPDFVRSTGSSSSSELGSARKGKGERNGPDSMREERITQHHGESECAELSRSGSIF